VRREEEVILGDGDTGRARDAQEGTRGRLGAAWGGIVGLYKARPNTGSAGAELVGLVFAAEGLLAEGKRAPALEALARAEALLEDLGVETGPPADGEGG
jgi:hypothetical protein